MKKTILSIIAVAVTLAASAQTVTINQGLSLADASNNVNIVQEGESLVTMSQMGDGGTFAIEQSFSLNRNIIAIEQYGSFNETNIEQLGASNEIFITQAITASSSLIDILQSGSANTIFNYQTGDGNDMYLNQDESAGSEMNAYQYDDGQTANITQYMGTSNYIMAAQYTDILGGNELNILQDGGSSNTISVIQAGDGNFFDITQTGSGNLIAGRNNPETWAVQNGTDNSAILSQSGSNNTIYFKQFGDSTSVIFTQMGSNNVANLNVRN
jgi:hypothetical protein